MNRLVWCVMNSTHRKLFEHFFYVAIIAFSFILHISVWYFSWKNFQKINLEYDLNLIIALSCFISGQRNICSQIHFSNMSLYFKVVQCIEYKIEFFKLISVELWVFNIDVMCLKLEMKIEFHSRSFCDLIIFLLASSLLLYIFKATIFINVLDFPDMLVSEHKLLIQILKINGIKASHVDFAEVSENRILE